jgi:hypothetical protein
MKFDKLVDAYLTTITEGLFDPAGFAAAKRDKEAQRSSRDESDRVDNEKYAKHDSEYSSEPARRQFKQRKPGEMFKDRNGKYWEVTDKLNPKTGQYSIKPANPERVKAKELNDAEGRRQGEARWKAAGKTEWGAANVPGGDID